MRLLLISNPERYEGRGTDVPESYSRLAQDERFEVYHLQTERVWESLEALPVTRVRPGDDFSKLPGATTEMLPVSHFDLAFCRSLKPFPPGYLERLRFFRIRFVNSPEGIAKHMKADFLPRIAAPYLPPHQLVTRLEEFTKFQSAYPEFVAKRPNSCGGQGVYRVRGLVADNVKSGTTEFDSLQALYDHVSTGGPLLLMRYLPRVVEGDKRVVVVNGKIYGAYLRRSRDGHWVQNVSSGGTCEVVDVCAREREAIAATASFYANMGVYVLGYDFLTDDDGRPIVSEINAGNIGGLVRLEHLTGQPTVQWLHEFLLELGGYEQSMKSVDIPVSSLTAL